MRHSLVLLAIVSVAGATAAHAQRQPAPTPAPAATNRVVVYKSPSCGCCGLWVTYMRNAGYTVEVHDREDVSPIKRAAGVPAAAESCHTAQIGGYVIEGHVPVESIRRLLRERPAVTGLAVPGMIVGTPGMEQGAEKPAYDVMAIQRNGSLTVYERR